MLVFFKQLQLPRGQSKTSPYSVPYSVDACSCGSPLSFLSPRSRTGSPPSPTASSSPSPTANSPLKDLLDQDPLDATLAGAQAATCTAGARCSSSSRPSTAIITYLTLTYIIILTYR